MTNPPLPDLTSGNNIEDGSEETSCNHEPRGPREPLLPIVLSIVDSVYGPSLLFLGASYHRSFRYKTQEGLQAGAPQ